MLLSSVLPILIIIVGGYFLIKLRFFFVLHPIKTARKTVSALKNREARRSLSLALAGTLGVGNIVGVAYGISVGGAGSLLWLLISSFFAGAIKYAESSLCKEWCGREGGSFAGLLSVSFRRFGRLFGRCYAMFCLILSFSVGSSFQSGSVVLSLGSGVEPLSFIAALLFFALVFSVVVGGVKKIENVTVKLIPIATIVYVLLCLGVVFFNLNSLGGVMRRIILEAFGFRSAGMGVSLYFALLAMKEGFARGLLSNEAGAGTSAMAETRAEALSPSEVGLFGICEVFFDTPVLSILTGLAILTSGVGFSGKSGIDIVTSTFFSLYSSAGVYTVFLLIFAFAFSSVISWYYYGISSCHHLFGKGLDKIYTALFLFFTLFGYKINAALLISVSDVLLLLMTVLTSAVLIKKSERVSHLSEKLLKNSDA